MQRQHDAADVVWRPSADSARSSNLAAFLQRFGIERADPVGYQQLLAAASSDPDAFWNRVIEHMGIQFYQPYERVRDSSKGIEWTQWCVGGTTNAILNCLDRHRSASHDQKDAVVWEAENGERRRWTYADLNAQTSRLADGLRALGCGPGDVIGVYMPMVPEAVAALLAIVKIGAIMLPLYSGFAPQAIADRMNDGGAVAILTVDGTTRRGKYYALKAQVDAAAANIPTLKHVVVLRNSGKQITWDSQRDHWWHELCAGRSDQSPTQIMPADAPMMLIYTSGTTGKPKGTVYTHCGYVTKLALDLGLCADFRASDRFMWMSDLGWLAGPHMVYGATLLGGAIVIAEGAHDFPDPGRYWRLIQDFAVSFLGIAPTIVRGFMQTGGSDVQNFDLSSLRITFSSGEAWTAGAWTWLFENVCRKQIPIINYSGGTEVGGGIVTGTAIHPMKPCAFSGPVPGMGADVVDERGQPIALPGAGELVLRRASIGLTRGLWRDPERYLESYWSRIPGVWWHGDRAEIDADGYWYVLGRSDDTLKIAGKRTGPSEIESLVASTGKVAEVVAIGVPDAIKGQSVVLVAVLMPGVQPGAETQKLLSDAVVLGLGASFRPSAVLFVADVPKTRNMKVMRRVVRAIYLGEPTGDLSSLVNPEVVGGLIATCRG